jgi:hypothetical protein
MLGDLRVGEAASRLNQGSRLAAWSDRLQTMVGNASGAVSLSSVSDQSGAPPDFTKAAKRMAIRFENKPLT